MAYKRKTWKNDSSTPLNADGLNDFDKRVGDAIDPIKIFPIDEGENNNGKYRIWSNGTLECWGLVSGTGNSISKPFPKKFSYVPTIVQTGTYVAGDGRSARLFYTIHPNSVNATAYVRDISTASAPGFEGSFSYYAIGKI